MHEFGYSLGLHHINIQGAIMYAYYTGYVPDLKLHSDNIVDIQYTEVSNYGLVSNFDLTTTFVQSSLHFLYFYLL